MLPQRGAGRSHLQIDQLDGVGLQFDVEGRWRHLQRGVAGEAAAEAERHVRIVEQPQGCRERLLVLVSRDEHGRYVDGTAACEWRREGHSLLGAHVGIPDPSSMRFATLGPSSVIVTQTTWSNSPYRGPRRELAPPSSSQYEVIPIVAFVFLIAVEVAGENAVAAVAQERLDMRPSGVPHGAVVVGVYPQRR